MSAVTLSQCHSVRSINALVLSLGLWEHLLKKECFLSGIARIPPSPHFGQLVHLFSDVKTNVLRV